MFLKNQVHIPQMRVPETLNLQGERPIPEYGVDFYFQSFFLIFITLVHFFQIQFLDLSLVFANAQGER